MPDETAEAVEEAPKRRGRPPKVKEETTEQTAGAPRQLAEHRARLAEADKVRNA